MTKNRYLVAYGGVRLFKHTNAHDSHALPVQLPLLAAPKDAVLSDDMLLSLVADKDKVRQTTLTSHTNAHSTKACVPRTQTAHEFSG